MVRFIEGASSFLFGKYLSFKKTRISFRPFRTFWIPPLLVSVQPKIRFIAIGMPCFLQRLSLLKIFIPLIFPSIVSRPQSDSFVCVGKSYDSFPSPSIPEGLNEKVSPGTRFDFSSEISSSGIPDPSIAATDFASVPSPRRTFFFCSGAESQLQKAR